jgi:hypothetical protein
VKLCDLIPWMIDYNLPRQKREMGVTANVILSLIDRMKNDAPLTRRYSEIEAYAYHTHGRIALNSKLILIV